ncbi:MAG: hypothetical protein K2W78_12755 [Xanthobacteraceae bacterium]|nr:hypothetical protein [Xanthobacteraceae bacterium]
MTSRDRVLKVLRTSREREIYEAAMAIDAKYQALGQAIIDTLNGDDEPGTQLRTLKQACAELGVDDRTLRRLRKKYPEINSREPGRKRVDVALLRRCLARDDAPILSGTTPVLPQDKSEEV